MIVLLISTAWLATLALVVSMCRMAAHGDGARARRGAPAGNRGVSPAIGAARSPRLLELSRGHARTGALKLEDRRAHTARAGKAATRSEAATAQHVGHRAQENLHVGP